MGRTAGYSATKTAAGNIRRSGSSAWSSCPSWVTALWRSAPSFAFPEGRTWTGSACGAAAQSRGSTFTIRWSWLLPTQNVVGVVDLSTNTVRMLVSDGIRYCTAVPVLGSRRTTRSVCIVDAQISPFLSKLARYGYVRAGSSYSVNFSALVSNTATLLPRYSVTVMRSWSSMFMRRARAFGVGIGYHVTFVVLASILPRWPATNSAIHRLFCESEITW